MTKALYTTPDVLDGFRSRPTTIAGGSEPAQDSLPYCLAEQRSLLCRPVTVVIGANCLVFGNRATVFFVDEVKKMESIRIVLVILLSKW